MVHRCTRPSALRSDPTSLDPLLDRAGTGRSGLIPGGLVVLAGRHDPEDTGPSDGPDPMGHEGRSVSVLPVSVRVLVIDNYDSFVYNLVQYLGELDAEPVVHRHDAVTLADVEELKPDAVLISPGPGRPEDAGMSTSIIHWAAGRVPLLGVCLGHQAIGAAWGGSVVRAPEVMHGKTSLIQHSGDGVFAGLPNPLEATRYHSLIVERDSVPDELEITATSEEGLVMGLRHREFDVEGVQFHPESILTTGGHDLLANFLARVS